ncbi:MAG: hypothetical protein AAFY41_09430, partial [Bacteroidota bacterium]
TQSLFEQKSEMKGECRVVKLRFAFMKDNAQLSGVCPQLVNGTKVVKSAEAHNGSKWHCVLKVKNSCEQKFVEITAISQRQIHGPVTLKSARKHQDICPISVC